MFNNHVPGANRSCDVCPTRVMIFRSLKHVI